MEKALATYYKKEEGYDLINNEFGFCAYRYEDETKNFYIGHFSVEEESRKDGESFKFFNQVRFRAKALGAERLIGDIFMNKFNYAEYTSKVMLHLRYGYKIIDVGEKRITVMKEI